MAGADVYWLCVLCRGVQRINKNRKKQVCWEKKAVAARRCPRWSGKLTCVCYGTERYGRDVDQVIKDMADGGRSRRAIEGEHNNQHLTASQSSTLCATTTGYKADIDDLSGGGAFPCVACDRHFVSEDAKVGHLKSKVHKRRMKQIDEGGWDPKDAELAAVRFFNLL